MGSGVSPAHKKYIRSQIVVCQEILTFSKKYSVGMRGFDSVILACPESFLFAVVKGAFFISI